MDPADQPEAEMAASEPMVPLLSSSHVPPALKNGEVYHVFISYSSTDHEWTESLISQLESCGLQVCYHERDFTPGRTVLENMSDCIQESQKVLLVLSSEFVRSRWCLLEANMSMFRDCLGRKPIVPVLLEQGISIPLLLCHLTYLEVDSSAFLDKLLKVLCTPNQQLQGSTVVPYQPPSIYNGKALQPLVSVNDESHQKWEAGQFSDMEVPDQLRLIIEDQDKYREAVRIVNSVSSKVWFRSVWKRVVVYLMGLFLVLVLFLCFAVMLAMELAFFLSLFFLVPLGLLIQIALWHNDSRKLVLREMQKAVGQANAILSKEKVLMGCLSSTKLYLVYVSLDGCRSSFTGTFSEQGRAEEMFQRALLYFSSGYTCCLAKRHFPFPTPATPGHLEGFVCFCQYVSQQLSKGEWK